MNIPTPVLVTGGSGFIGKAVVARLVAKGLSVRIVSRHAENFKNPEKGFVEYENADILSSADLKRAMRGVKVVVHCAAPIGDWGSYRHFYDGIVRGTGNVLEAAMEARVEKFVHLSSTLVYGLKNHSVLNEESALTEDDFPYSQAKAIADRVVQQAMREERIPAAILRPGNVYGPGSLLWTDRPAQMMTKGLFALPKRHGSANAVFVETVAQAIETVLSHEKAMGNAFNIVDGVNRQWVDFFTPYLEVLGRKKVRLVPNSLLFLASLSSEFLGLIIRRPPLLTRFAYRFLTFEGRYSGEKAERLLNFKPEISPEEAMNRTCQYIGRTYGGGAPSPRYNQGP